MTPKPPPIPPNQVDQWARSLLAALKRCEKREFYGEIRVVLFKGKVKQVRIESSHVSPDSLAQDLSTT